MSDYMIRGVAADGMIRVFAATTKDTVEEMRARHNTSPVISAALGRLLTAALMMGSMMKGENDKLTLKVTGDGPAQGLFAVADSKGHVKGYAIEPQVLIHANEKGKLDVAGAVGKGLLTVIKDIGMKEPSTGTCELVSGEIAEDLTYYFAASEQTPSSVGLGVLMNKENTVRQAGGFILQLMPGVDDETIDMLEERLGMIDSVTAMLEQGMTPEDILDYVVGDFGLEILEKTPVSFKCGCSKEKIQRAILSLGRDDLMSLVEEQETVEAHCDYCNTYYVYESSDLKKLMDEAR